MRRRLIQSAQRKNYLPEIGLKFSCFISPSKIKSEAKNKEDVEKAPPNSPKECTQEANTLNFP
jgi:hypothetical protein